MRFVLVTVEQRADAVTAFPEEERFVPAGDQLAKDAEVVQEFLRLLSKKSESRN